MRAWYREEIQRRLREGEPLPGGFDEFPDPEGTIPLKCGHLGDENHWCPTCVRYCEEE